MYISEARQEIIRIFMEEARKKHVGLKKGLGKPIYQEAIGLVEVAVAFEAFINELVRDETQVREKRIRFSSEYQSTYENSKKALEPEVMALKNELDNGAGLINMKNPNRPNYINITNPDNLSEIIEIVYRVRSNLVHGSKSLDSARNKILIENSFHFLYKFLDNILREEGII